jgi:hypothetical protein
MGLSETNVDWKQADVMPDIASTFKQKFGAVHLRTSTSNHKPLTNLQHHLRAYKPGGTATITTGKFVGRIEREDFNDPLGNFSSVMLKGRNGAALSIATAYRVVQSSGAHAGTQTAYQQPYNLLRPTERRPDPRNQVLNDLQKFIGDKQLIGNGVVQMIGANESTDCRNSAINKLREDLQLIDLHRL